MHGRLPPVIINKVVILLSPGWLPNLKRSNICNAELVDLAFHLLIHDLFPFAKELGININKLASYRPAFHPSHLEMGTIKLLVERRDDIAELIKIVDLHYRTVAITVWFGKNIFITNLKCLFSFRVQKDHPVKDRLR